MQELRYLTREEYTALLRDKAPRPDPDCKHERVLRPFDRPSHDVGWHPGICAKCGADLDVDSSG